MELQKAIVHILDGTAVLFAGNGFTTGAKNQYGVVPSASKLKEQLLNGLHYSKDENASDYGLEVLAGLYKKKQSAAALVNLLKEQYNILHVEDHHEQLANLKWKRIYTTNYDQTIEIASKSTKYGQPCFLGAVILTDDFDSINKKNVCIHLNGYIEKLTEDKLDTEFKLTEKSYSCDTLEGNRWFELMCNDFEAASVIVIIGFSMQYDIDIKRLLSTPAISKKVIFVTSPKPKQITLDVLGEYGSCYALGVEGFSEEVKKVKKDYVPSITSTYRSFRHIYHDTHTPSAPTYEEITHLYTLGDFSEKLLTKDGSGMYKYLLNRRAIDVFLRDYRTHKVYIAVSNLGNGKSVFLDMVINELRRTDINVFKYVQRFESIDEEIAAICNERKYSVVVFDNYPGHMDLLRKFYYYGHGNITFLLAARTSVNQMFYKRLVTSLGIQAEDIRPLNLHRIMAGTETKELANILEVNKLLPANLSVDSNDGSLEDFITNECDGYFSALLLKIFESSAIKDKIVDLYDRLEQSKNITLKRVAIFVLLKSISNYEISVPQIYDIFQADYLQFANNDDEFIQEIFTKNDDTGLTVRSSVVSQYIIKNIIKLVDIIDTMKIAFLAADKKGGMVYRELQKSMVSHSQFKAFTNANDTKAREQLIEMFYNDIRNSKFAQHNTFFWEQFASAYIDMKKYDMVNRCLQTAFREAQNREDGFVPFQVYTVQGRYLVEKAFYEYTKGVCSVREAAEAIKTATNSILRYYDHPENNRYYVFKVINSITELFNLIELELENRELKICIESMTLLNKRIGDYITQNPYTPYFKRICEWKDNLVQALSNAKNTIKGM